MPQIPAASLPDANAVRDTPIAARRLTYVRHAVPGGTIELARIVGGVSEVEPMGDAAALDLGLALLAAYHSNMRAKG